MFEMGAKEIQKNQINGKLEHGVMIRDVVPRKNNKHGIPRFHRKTLHKKCHQGGLHLAFYPIELGLCKLYSKLLYLESIFGSDVHLSIANNFHN
jgi:hypothetical protein